MQGYRVAGSSLIALGALGGLLLGCSEKGPQLVPETDPDRTNLPTHAHRAVVSSEGAVISGGDAKVVIPRGALAEPVEIVVEATEEGFGAIPNAGEERVLAFLPHGTQFLKPVTIQVPHEHGSRDALALLTSEPGQPWAKVEGATFTGAYAEADVMHFSFFFASPTPASEIVGMGGSGGTGGAGDDLGLGGGAGTANAAGASGDGGATGGLGDAGGAPGEGDVSYLEQGVWHGQLYAGTEGASQVVRDGLCIAGEVAAHELGASFALWGWNINQEEGSDVVSAWTPDTDTLAYDLSSGGAPLRLNVYDEQGQTYCHVLSNESGTVTLTHFNTQCWNGQGVAYDGATPLAGVQVLVPGNTTTVQPFAVCVNAIGPLP